MIAKAVKGKGFRGALDYDLGNTAARAQRDRNAAVRRRELGCVGEQVAKDLRKAHHYYQTARVEMTKEADITKRHLILRSSPPLIPYRKVAYLGP